MLRRLTARRVRIGHCGCQPRRWWIRPSRLFSSTTDSRDGQVQDGRQSEIKGELPAGLSPVVLAIARRVACEHSELTSRLSDNYDSTIARRAGELDDAVGALEQWDKSVENLIELQSMIESDHDLQVLAHDEIPIIMTDLVDARKRLESALVPKHKWDHMSCLIEIRPGAGGDEAGLFASELSRMYLMFLERKGIEVRVIKWDVSGVESEEGSLGSTSGSLTSGGSGGISHTTVLTDQKARLIEAVFEVQSKESYGLLRTEAGVHRVQRVPATESKGRTHTSSAAVIVLPLFPEEGQVDDDGSSVDKSSIHYIDPKEVRLDVMRARGAGGQHVNRTESAVRLTHLPTGISVSMQDSRSQPRNKAKAWQVLRSRLVARRMAARMDEDVKLRRSIVRPDRIGRENKVRTYNWHGQRVTDHRSAFTVTSALDDVLAGGETLERVMDSVRAWMVDVQLAELLQDEKDKSDSK